MVEKGKIRILPCEGSLQNINEKRAEMELDPMVKYVENLKAIYRS